MHPLDGDLDQAQTPLASLIIGLERPVFVVANRLREVVALRSERLITVNRVREGGPRDRSERGEKEQSEERSELLHCVLSARPRQYSNTASACARKSALLRTCTGGTANWSVSHRQNDSTRSRSMAAHSRRAPGARYVMTRGCCLRAARFRRQRARGWARAARGSCSAGSTT